MIWVGVLVAAAGCYGLKLTGLSVPARVLDDPRVQRAAKLLPVGLLGALIATQTFSDGRQLVFDARVAGVAVAVVAVKLRAPFLAVVALASVTTALLRLLA